MKTDRELARDIVGGLKIATAKSFNDEGITATFEFVALGEVRTERLGGPNVPQTEPDDGVTKVGVGARVGKRKAVLTVKPSTKDINASLSYVQAVLSGQ